MSKIIRSILIAAEFGCRVAALYFYYIGNYPLAIFLMLWGILFEIRTNAKD